MRTRTNKNICYGSIVLELFNIINSLRYLKFPMHFADLICSSGVKYLEETFSLKTHTPTSNL